MPLELAQKIGGIGMRFDEMRIDPAGFLIGGKRVFEIALVFARIAEIGMGRGKMRIEHNRPFGARRSRGEIADGAVDRGEIGKGLGIVGLQRDRLADMFGRRPMIAIDMRDEAEMMPGHRILGLSRKDLRIEIAGHAEMAGGMEFERAMQELGGWKIWSRPVRFLPPDLPCGSWTSLVTPPLGEVAGSCP